MSHVASKDDPLSSYFIIVNSSTEHPRHQTAIETVAKLSEDNVVDVFFYEDAVYAGSAITQAPAGATSCAQKWSLVKTDNVSLTLCIAAAVRRGIFDQQESKRYDKPVTMDKHFTLSGLGLVAEALHNKRQILQF